MSIDLSKEISEIKKYNRFGMLDISEHALTRVRERDLNIDIIMKFISEKSTTIVQYHKPFEYHNNRDELFVLYGKVNIKKGSKPLHVVVAKSCEMAVKYKIVTCYIPSKTLFYAHGRKLRQS